MEPTPYDVSFSGFANGVYVVADAFPAKFATGDPESESENELRDDHGQAVSVKLELQEIPRALASEECSDRAASEPTKLLERDQELSDLGGASTARLCKHHSQLSMLSG